MATAAAAASGPIDIGQIKQKLEKKLTFTKALDELAAHAEHLSETNSVRELLPLVSRAHLLLRSRYSSPGFWRAGQALFEAFEKLNLDEDSLSNIRRYVSDANDVLSAGDGASQPGHSEAESGHAAFQSLPSTSRRSYFSDVGPLVDAPPLPTGVAVALGHPGAAETAPPMPQAVATTRPSAIQAEQSRADIQQAILEGLQAVYSGVAAVTRGTEAVEAELEHILSMLADTAEVRPRAPPASKKVVASLPVLHLTNAELGKLGAGVQCPVCTEELHVDEDVQVLPCKHVYHVPCLAPWLSHHNSCPVCRHELPTDDHEYEYRKERAAEEEADRRGAANALSHNEFMYV